VKRALQDTAELFQPRNCSLLLTRSCNLQSIVETLKQSVQFIYCAGLRQRCNDRL